MAGRRLEYGLLVVLATLWAASYTFVALAVHEIPPLTLITARTVIAGTALAMLLRLRGLRLPRDSATWWRCAVQSGLSSVSPFLLIAWGQQSVPSALAVILSSTSPIFAFLFGLAMGQAEARSWRKALGVVVGFGGACLILGWEAVSGPVEGVLPLLALLASGACFGAGAHVARSLQTMDPMIPAAASLLIGSVLLLPLCLLTEEPWRLSPGPVAVLALLGLALLSTALAVLIYFRLLRTLGVVGTTAQAYLRLPIGTALGVFLLGETLPATAWPGLALVMGGVVLMTLPQRRYR